MWLANRHATIVRRPEDFAMHSFHTVAVAIPIQHIHHDYLYILTTVCIFKYEP